MGRLFIGVVAAIALLTAGALLLVHRLTEPLPVSASGRSAAAPAVEPAAGPSWLDPGRDAPGFQAAGDRGAPITGPAASEASRAVPNQPPATQVPALEGQEGGVAEDDETQATRGSPRRASPVEKRNQRIRQRGGAPQQGQE